MSKVTRWSASLVAVVLLMAVAPASAAARSGNPTGRGGTQHAAQTPAYYSGWITIDLARSWSAPSPRTWLVENDMYMFVRRFNADLALELGGGSNPPGSVRITSRTFDYYALMNQRLEPPADAGDMCRGFVVTLVGKGIAPGYSGGASGSATVWQIPGLRFIPSPTTPDITFREGNCEPGRRAGEESSMASLQRELSMPGDVQWTFTEGLRTPLQSRTPTSIEGSCDAEVYSQLGGRVQCSWFVRIAAPRLVPPRRR